MFLPQGWRLDLVGIPPEEQWPTMLGFARKIDPTPAYSFLWVNDDFHTVPVPSEEATHEAWTLMTAFAATTERLGLGQMCTAHYQPLIPADELERYQRMYRTGPLVGTPKQLVERLREAEQMGMTYAIGKFADAAYDPASMDLFANADAAEFA